MATDLSLPIKTAVIGHLKNSANVTALVPAARIYTLAPPDQPTWPFIRYGSPIASGFDATCWPGSDMRITLHAFAESGNGYAGEDRALEIAAGIVAAMRLFSPDTVGIVENLWIQTQCFMEDREADRWHSVAEFNIIAVETNWSA